MRRISSTIAALAVLAATEASAQSINLTGPYRCVEACRAGLVGSPAFVTQNGPNFNLLNEAGQPARAWPDWFAPATRIWIDAWNEGAVYSPDGMTHSVRQRNDLGARFGTAAPASAPPIAHAVIRQFF
jgi:hypothetical protein